MTLQTIADGMAACLRHHQCAGVIIGQWPAFKAGAKFVPRACNSCKWLAEYDAIVPAVKPNQLQRDV